MGDGLERLLEGKRLSPVQRRIAHYLTEHLPEAIFLSSIELAGRAGVSQPSVTRFAMALGFTGYPELRQALRPLVVGGEIGLGEVARAAAQALGVGVFAGTVSAADDLRTRDLDSGPRSGTPLAGGPRGAGPRDESPRDEGSRGDRPDGDGWGRGGSGGRGPNELQAAVDNEIGNLALVRDRLGDPSTITELATALAVSEPLPVLGLRVSSGLATTFAYYARRIHPDVRLLVHGGSELTDGLHAARKAGAGWLLAVVLPRYPAEAVRALELAGELGLRTAVITDREDLPFPADVVLAAPVGERLVFDSHVAPLTIAMVLVEAMADAAPLRTQARLEEYERMTDRTGVFLQP